MSRGTANANDADNDLNIITTTLKTRTNTLDATMQSNFSLPGGDSGQTESMPPEPFTETSLTLLHANVCGFHSKSAFLQQYLQELKFPSLVVLNETFLNKATIQPQLHGYTLVGRRDRGEQPGGGVILFALDSVALNVVHLSSSTVAERMWFLLHTNHGPFVLCVWYYIISWYYGSV